MRAIPRSVILPMMGRRRWRFPGGTALRRRAREVCQAIQERGGRENANRRFNNHDLPPRQRLGAVVGNLPTGTGVVVDKR